MQLMLRAQSVDAASRTRGVWAATGPDVRAVIATAESVAAAEAATRTLMPATLRRLRGGVNHPRTTSRGGAHPPCRSVHWLGRAAPPPPTPPAPPPPGRRGARGRC